jgi:type 1 fimbria pilin
MHRKGGTALFLLTLFIVGNADATASQGEGRVRVKGEVLESACAIDTLNRDQTINMKVLPVSQIQRDGHGEKYRFSVKLINCVLKRLDPKLPDWSRFQITFDGQNDTGLFGINGEAKGIAIKITDEQGNIATPGKAMPAAIISPGDMLLNYSLHLVSNNQRLHAGEFSSTVKFRMDYY